MTKLQASVLIASTCLLLIPHPAKAQFATNDCTRTSTKLVPHIGVDLLPVTDMGPLDSYKGESGGLYGNNYNQPPPTHLQQVNHAIAQVVPRNAQGNPSPTGKIGVISIGMSNTRREFNTFISSANNDPVKSPSIVFINAAQEGQVASSWAMRPVDTQPNPNPWPGFDDAINRSGLTPSQVQVVWMKITNANPDQPGTDDHPVYAQTMLDDLGVIVQRLGRDYPAIQIVYLSTRLYAGYTLIDLSPEPSSYESAFAMRWLIQDQINSGGSTGTTYQNSPLLVWGPYLWANGLKPRNDGLIWTCNDFVSDGVHPSESAKQKVSAMLLDFFKTDPLASPWFTGNYVTPSVTPTQTPPSPTPVPGDQDNDSDLDIYDVYLLLMGFPSKTISEFNQLIRYF